MTFRNTTAAVLLTLLVTATVAVGCGRAPSAVAPQTEGWPQATAEPTTTGPDGEETVATTTAIAADPKASSGADVEALKAELSAMERELRQDVLPSDSDFNDAAGSLY